MHCTIRSANRCRFRARLQAPDVSGRCMHPSSCRINDAHTALTFPGGEALAGLCQGPHLHHAACRDISAIILELKTAQEILLQQENPPPRHGRVLPPSVLLIRGTGAPVLLSPGRIPPPLLVRRSSSPSAGLICPSSIFPGWGAMAGRAS